MHLQTIPLKRRHRLQYIEFKVRSSRSIHRAIQIVLVLRYPSLWILLALTVLQCPHIKVFNSMRLHIRFRRHNTQQRPSGGALTLESVWSLNRAWRSGEEVTWESQLCPVCVRSCVRKNTQSGGGGGDGGAHEVTWNYLSATRCLQMCDCPNRSVRTRVFIYVLINVCGCVLMWEEYKNRLCCLLDLLMSLTSLFLKGVLQLLLLS